jgi:hypothetical protein
MTPALPFALDESIFADVEGEDSLRANTQEGECVLVVCRLRHIQKNAP